VVDALLRAGKIGTVAYFVVDALRRAGYGAGVPQAARKIGTVTYFVVDALGK